MDDGSEMPLLFDITASDTRRSRHALGVLAADEMLDKSEALSSGCWVALLLLLLQLLREDAVTSDPDTDSESDENSRESVRPASAMRRRRRSAVPSRLQGHAL